MKQNCIDIKYYNDELYYFPAYWKMEKISLCAQKMAFIFVQESFSIKFRVISVILWLILLIPGYSISNNCGVCIFFKTDILQIHG